ncbi:MAG: tetratricopeptide repeat protein [Gammaproteobacteria bacterium]|nr:tetratricopeptide repeat protein [Gammaproteobacteria bacterium]
MTTNITYSALLALLIGTTAAIAQDSDVADAVMVGPLDQTVPVAEEETPSPAEEIVSEERLLNEFTRYREYIQEGSLDEADVAAKRIVELAIRVYGPMSRETASALNNLGIVQHSSGQYDAAIQNFSSSIEIIETVEDRLHNALVNPLKGLGSAQMANGRPDIANRTYNRAAHITQVNEGPHNLDQVEILESMAESFIRMGDTKQARNTLDRIHIINVKHFEKNPLGLIPSLMNRASWQHRAGYYNEERASYRRAIRIVESGGGKDDPMLIEPLRRLGESFYFSDMTSAMNEQRGLVSTGEMYFKRAARIAEKTEGLDWREVAKTKLALADYYTYIESQNRSRRIYAEVWKSLSADDERLLLRDQEFSQPLAISVRPLPSYAGGVAESGGDRSDLHTGKIEVTYTVTTRGHVRDLETRANPPEFTDMQTVVHREFRRRVFRPQIVNGKIVEATERTFTHSFSYLQADLESLRESRAKASTATKAGKR